MGCTGKVETPPTVPETPGNENASITIEGTAKVGETLTATAIDPNGVPANVAYQWLADNVAIPGATAKTYTLKTEQVGKAITVEAVFTDNDGYAESVTSAASEVVTSITPESNLIPTDYILAYDFNGDTLDKSINNLDGISTGDLSFVEGRKAGTQALEFNAGRVSTPNDLPINSDKLTISFWIKSNSNAVGAVFELSPLNTSGAHFAVFTSHRGEGRISALLSSTNRSNEVSATKTLAEGVYYHVLITMDRSRASEKNSIYINNIKTPVTEYDPHYVAANFSNEILYIGSRSAGLRFKGELQDIRIYNRILNTEERASLFNE